MKAVLIVLALILISYLSACNTTSNDKEIEQLRKEAELSKKEAELAKKELTYQDKFDHVIINKTGQQDKALQDLEKIAL